MTHYDVKTPEEIEAEIEAQRLELRRTMGDINDRFSGDGMMRGLTDSLTQNGAEIGQTVSRAVSRNPAAVALAGAGLAWLAYSLTKSDDPVRRLPTPEHDPALTIYGVEDEGEAPSPWYARARDAARERAGRVSASAGAKAGELREGAHARAEMGRAKARAYGSRARASAHELRARIADGTEKMSEEGRRRVIAAREQAYEARVKAEYYARQSGRKAQGFYDEQPLVVGALAVAVGAALGGLLPRTRHEDQAFGAHSDRLFDEAERVYREERAKLEHVARETGREAEKQARGVMDEIRRDAKATYEDARKKGEEAAEEVKSTAKKSAEEEGLTDKPGSTTTH